MLIPPGFREFLFITVSLMFGQISLYGQRIAALEFSTTTNASQLGVNFVTGYQFTVNSAIWLTALGAALSDSPSKAIFGALPASMQVGLWDSSQNLLATATVSSTDPLVGNFNYATSPVVALSAGQSYTVAGFVPAGKSVLSNVPGLTGATQISNILPRSLISNSLVFPPGDNIGQPNGYFGATFAFSTSQPSVIDAFFSLTSLSGATAEPGCANGATDFTVSAVLLNNSAQSFSDLSASVITLTGGNTLVSQSWPATVAGNQPVTGTFRIRLASCNPFQFFFDVLGTTL